VAESSAAGRPGVSVVKRGYGGSSNASSTDHELRITNYELRITGDARIKLPGSELNYRMNAMMRRGRFKRCLMKTCRKTG